MNEYFQTSRPLSRSRFIELCREASQLTLLMYAPLGLPSMVENLWSESELQDFRDHYRQWEDALSTHIYNWKQIPADRVAASMHHYIEVKKDELVLGAIQLESLSCGELVDLPRVVELVDESTADAGVNSPESVAKLLKQLLDALSIISGCMDLASMTSSYWTKKYAVDAEVRDSLGCVIGKRQFCPNDLAPLLKAAEAGSQTTASATATSSATAASPTTPPLLASLIQTLDKALCLSLNNNSSSAKSGCKVVKVTVRQFHALLTLHEHSVAVQQVLAAHLPSSPHNCPSSLPSGLSLLDAFRIGLYWPESQSSGPWPALGLGVSPVVSLAVQLEARARSGSGSGRQSSEQLAALRRAMASRRKARDVFNAKQEQGANGDDDEDEGDDEEDDEGKIKKKLSALQLINQALEAGEEEEEEVWETDDEEEGDEEEGDEEEEDDEEEEEEGNEDANASNQQPVLPACLLTSLYTDRAEFTSANYAYDPLDEDQRPPAQRAQEDLDHALAMDPFCARAYGLRAMLSSAGDQNGFDDDAEDEEEDEDQEQDRPQKQQQLMSAAKAALAAFLLGGSADLSLAAAAEEALRKQSRSRARHIFLHRKDGSGAEAWAVPRGWQAQAYLAGFELPSVGLEVVGMLKGVEGECVGEVGGEAEDGCWGRGIVIVREAVRLLEEVLLTEGCAGIAAENDNENYRGGLYHELANDLEGAEDDGNGNDGEDSDDDDNDNDGEDRMKVAGGNLRVDTEDFDDTPLAQTFPVSPAANLALPSQGCKLVQFARYDSTPPPSSPTRTQTQAQACSSSSASGPLSLIGPRESPHMRQLLTLFCTPEVEALSGVRFIERATANDAGDGTGRGLEVEIVGGEQWPSDGSDWDWDWDWDAVLERSRTGAEAESGAAGAQAGLAPAAIRARLLSLAGSLCYLLGLSKSAVVCFRLSIRHSPALPDTLVKLAALLNDMDDPKGAHVLFGRASTLLASRGSGSGNGSGSGSGAGAERGRGQIFCLLHMAELAANQSDFDEAVSLLGQAKRLNDSLSGFEAAAIKAKAKAEAEAEAEVNGTLSRQAQRLRLKHYSQVHFTILTLLGVTLFRLSPTSPEGCLGVLRPAVAEAKAQRRAHKRRQRQLFRQHDSSEQPSAAIHNSPDPPHGTVGHVYLLLCMGEVLAQCGDLSGSLNLFRQASRLYPQHPLPFINAARSYQQLNQRTLAAQHLARAIELDPLFPLPHVDAAQSLLYQGKVEASSEALERALTLARHVGDIKDVVVAQIMTALTRELQEERLFLIDA